MLGRNGLHTVRNEPGGPNCCIYPDSACIERKRSDTISLVSIASLISGVERLEVINSAVPQALLRAAGKCRKVGMNAYESAAAYHRSVRLLYQIIGLIIIE